MSEPSVFEACALALTKLRRAERHLEFVRQKSEQTYVEAAGGVKAFGPNIIDQERAFAILLAEDRAVMDATSAYETAEADYELAKARERAFECEARRVQPRAD